MHFASAGINFDYWLGKKNQKNAIFSHFWPSFQEWYICIILTLFLFFWLSWSQEISFYIPIMVVAHSFEQQKNKNFDFFWKFENFSNFQKKSKFSFFLLLTPMRYDHDENIKSYFLTSGNQKNKKQVKIMHRPSCKWRSKMTKNCIFFPSQ